MDLVVRELKARLRRGMNQNELAQSLGLHVSTLSEILNGKRTPSEKTLKLIGIKRSIVYEYIDGRGKNPNSHAWHTNSPELAESDISTASQPESAALGGTPPGGASQPVLTAAPPLTAERIKVAVRYKLNPGKTWADFTLDLVSHPQDVDAGWLAYCEERGTAPSAAPVVDRAFYAPLGNGDAVRLKPQRIVQDFRPPLALGELPPAPVLTTVEVGIRQMAEAEANFKAGSGG